jgi:F-type H+-transporting ATPase subunit gamma
MKMISISKLRVIQSRLDGYRNYFKIMEDILKNTAAAASDVNHPFLRRIHNETKILLYIISADTGLCGAYNTDLLNAVSRFVALRPDVSFTFVPIGKKAIDFIVKRKLITAGSYSGLGAKYSDKTANEISEVLIKLFLSDRFDAVYCAYTRFEAGARVLPSVEKVLAIDIGAPTSIGFSFEPDADEVLKRIVPSYVNSKVRFCLMNAFACEHSARGIAMGEATDNAKELLDNLILIRNKVRQAGITREIIEVISSSEALRG